MSVKLNNIRVYSNLVSKEADQGLLWPVHVVPVSVV